MLPQPQSREIVLTILQKRTVRAERTEAPKCLYYMRIGARFKWNPLSSAEAMPGRLRLLLRRLLLLAVCVIQCSSYFVLTQIRYESQGLQTAYFSFLSLGDVLSAALFFCSIYLLLSIIIKPHRLTVCSIAFTTGLTVLLIWLLLGIWHTSPEEFTPEAAIVLLLILFIQLSVLLSFMDSSVSSLHRLLHIARNTFLVSLFFVVFAFVFVLFYPSVTNKHDVNGFQADAGVILGAAVWNGNGLGERPSPALRERIDLGHELVMDHEVSRLVLTGGNAPGKLAEAKVARVELLKLGVDPSNIIEESTSHSTLEQVLFLRDELFHKKGWKRFVIVSDQYHLARVCEMCKCNGLTVIGTPSHLREPVVDLAYYYLRESVALLEYWFLGR